MGKSTKKANVIGGVLNINGQDKAATTYDGNNMVSSYNMSPFEQQTLNFVENQLLENAPKLNTFSDETLKQMQKEVDAFTQTGVKTINDTYAPMIQDLQENVASRFGNLDNSVFLDNLNSIESKRQDAIVELADNVASKQSELINEKLTQQYDYLNWLTNLQNNIYSNMYNAIGSTQKNSNVQYVDQNNFGLSDVLGLAKSAASSLF